MANPDETLFIWINGFAGVLPVVDGAARWVASDYLAPMTLALALAVIWFMERDQETRLRYQTGTLAALTAMAMSSLTVFIINMVYFRPRPFVELDVNLLFYQPTDSSFPSNAASATFGMAFGIWGIHRGIGWAAIAGAGIYGLARVYAGVHYPLDVTAGAVIGAATAFIAFRLRDLAMPVLVCLIKCARILRLA